MVQRKVTLSMNKNRILLVMSLSLFIGYLPWYNYSAVMPYISKEFGFTSAQEGLIVSAFQLGYVLVVLITGYLADKVGSRKVVAWATLCTAIFASVFTLVAHDFWSTLFMRLLTGLSAGAIYAPGMSLLANWFPARERGKAMGAYTAGLVASYAGGYFIASPLAAAFNWRIGMLATSLPVFLAAFLVFAFVQERPKTQAQFDGAPEVIGGAAQPAPDGGYWGPVLLTGSYMGHMWELYAFWGYIGSFMMACCTRHNLPAATGGFLAALIILIGAPAVYVMGLLADKWGRTKAILISATASLLPEFCFGYLLDAPLGLTMAVGLWMGFWVIADSAIYKAGLTDMISDKVRGTILGVQSAVGFSMTVLAPVAFGTLLGKLNHGVPTIEATVWGPCFIMLGLGALLSPLFAWLTRKTAQARLMTNGKM